MFIDRVEVHLEAGKGGNGVVAWRREKYIPKGGPTGGNGGNGGSLYIEADVQVHALDWYRHRKIIKAENGVQGGPNGMQGRRGKDIILKVPCGTLVKDVETGELICDLTKDKERFLLCQGGRGGKGNEHFKTPTNQAPNYATPGKLGQLRRVELELKLIADIGLVGFPNAGKSTLITKLAHAKVKVAPYPFTTLHPNLGVLCSNEQRKIILADIPGIIENAHLNRGLGIEFLRHIERTKLLVFVLDASGIDGRSPLDDYLILRNELREYDPALIHRPYFVVLNKIDTPESELFIEEFRKKVNENIPYLFEVSALESQGLDHLKKEMIRFITTELSSN